MKFFSQDHKLSFWNYLWSDITCQGYDLNSASKILRIGQTDREIAAMNPLNGDMGRGALISGECEDKYWWRKKENKTMGVWKSHKAS